MSATCIEATKTFTLNDLVKIALGAPKLTREHLGVFQSLLIILMRKLNCHNEKVRIRGFPATCIKKLMDEAKDRNPPSDFKLQNVGRFKEKFELIEKLEKRTQEVEKKLEQHYDVIRNFYETSIYQVQNWDHYAAPNEDLCSLYMPQNKEVCLLLRNVVFNTQLRRRSTRILNDKNQVFQNRIEQMRSTVQKLTEDIKEAEPGLDCLKYVIQDIEKARSDIEKDNERFRETVAETQEMLNCKVERIALPALKKFLFERFRAVKEFFKKLTAGSDKCDLWKALTIEKSTCISCSIYDELKHLYNEKPIQSFKENERCFCNNSGREASILTKVDRMTPLLLNLGAQKSVSNTCLSKSNTKLKTAGILKRSDSMSLKVK